MYIIHDVAVEITVTYLDSRPIKSDYNSIWVSFRMHDSFK